MDNLKLKLTDLATGQESLLLVTKINTKGLLVQAAKTLPIGTHVQLVLQFDEMTSMVAKGEVYKIAERATGQKGMIIRFTNPSSQLLKKIDERAKTSPQEEEPAGESQDYSANPSVNKTVVLSTDQDTLSILTFSPPKTSKKPQKIAATLDEEVAKQNFPDFGEETRLVAQAEYDSFVRKTKTPLSKAWLFIPTAILILGLAFWLGFRVRVPGQAPVVVTAPTPTINQTPKPTPTPTLFFVSQPNEPPTPLPTLAPTSAPAVERKVLLKAIRVEETKAFVKVTFVGDNLDHAVSNRVMSPRKLVLHWDNGSVKDVATPMAIVKNPLLRIRHLQKDSGLDVNLELYPVNFPRYDLKPNAEGLVVYLYR